MIEFDYIAPMMTTKTKISILPVLIWILALCPAGCADDSVIKPGNGDDANSVVVASLTAAPGEKGVIIPVLVTNDTELRGVNVPLVLRQTAPGAFVTSLQLTFGDRMPANGALTDVRFTNLYFAEDGTCKSNQSGGFASIAFSDTLEHTVNGSPAAVLFARHRIAGPNLAPGTDNSGSFILTVDVSATRGKFEIDTTCANPANHLLYVTTDADRPAIIPAFTKGTVTIE